MLLKYNWILQLYNYIHTPFNRDLTSTIINKYVQLKIICHNSSLAALQNLWFIWIHICHTSFVFRLGSIVTLFAHCFIPSQSLWGCPVYTRPCGPWLVTRPLGRGHHHIPLIPYIKHFRASQATSSLPHSRWTLERLQFEQRGIISSKKLNLDDKYFHARHTQKIVIGLTFKILK